MPTTPRGYPIFTGSMPPAGPVQMQQLAEAIDADVTAVTSATEWSAEGVQWLNGFGPAIAVSGWQPFAYRRWGKFVSISGTVTRATAWTANTAALMMPAALRPSRQAQSSSCRMGEDGTMLVIPSSAEASLRVALHLEYLIR